MIPSVTAQTLILNKNLEKEEYHFYIQNLFLKNPKEWDKHENLKAHFDIFHRDVKTFDELTPIYQNIVKATKQSALKFCEDQGQDILDDQNKSTILKEILEIFAIIELPEEDLESETPSRGTSPLELALDKYSTLATDSPSSSPFRFGRKGSVSESFALGSSPCSHDSESFVPKVKILPSTTQERKIKEFFKNFISHYVPFLLHSNENSYVYQYRRKIGEEFEGVFPLIAKKLYERTPVILEHKDRSIIASALKGISLFFNHLNKAIEKIVADKTKPPSEADTILFQLSQFKDDLPAEKRQKFSAIVGKIEFLTISSEENKKLSLKTEEEQLIDEINKHRNENGKLKVLTIDLELQKVFQQLKSYINDLILILFPEDDALIKFIKTNVCMYMVDNFLTPFTFGVIIDRLLQDGLPLRDIKLNQPTSPIKILKRDAKNFEKDMGHNIHTLLTEFIKLGAPKGLTNFLTSAFTKYVKYKAEKIGSDISSKLDEIMATPSMIRPIIVLDQLLFKEEGVIRIPTFIKYFKMNEETKKKFQAGLEKKIDDKLYDYFYKKLGEKKLAWTVDKTESLHTFCNTISNRLFRLTQQENLTKMLIIYTIEAIMDGLAKDKK